MLWIDELLLARIGLVVQLIGVTSMVGVRCLAGEAKSFCAYLFVMSLLFVGGLVALSVSQGSYDWPIMGITLSVMTVGAIVETKPAAELNSGQI